MKRLAPNELSIVLGLVFVFVIIRSLYFPYHLNFSTDQAAFAARALELWREKKLTLIGPSISLHYIGRDLYQGSITYYFQLLFLLLGDFEPIVSSYLFMLFAALTIFPLYYGVRMVINKQTALAAAIVYALFPFYIDYTRFFWNPNFQFVLAAFLIFLMGSFHRQRKPLIFFLLAAGAGGLLLFHYQFLFVIMGGAIYYFMILKLPKVWLVYFALGVLLGFSPILIFEARNQFYNTRTLILFLTRLEEMPSGGKLGLNYHYFLTLSLFGLISVLYSGRKHINYRLCAILFLLLLTVSLFRYARAPAHAFGMTDDWNYPQEKKANDLIRRQNLTDYNIVNLAYDTVATVQKYLLKKDRVQLNFDDYYHNRYLFVVSRTADFMDNPAYEVNTFTPSRRLKKWPINQTYTLYLLERYSSQKTQK